MSLTANEQGTQQAISAWERDVLDDYQRKLQGDRPRPMRTQKCEWPERDTPLFAKPIPGPKYI